ncbi:MAG TPA: ferrous iron transport protein A [Anaerolineae bacterium]|nr:ferrous iron transport protein A [Anaerolineae bacterium]
MSSHNISTLVFDIAPRPLSAVPRGESVRLVRIDAGRRLTRRLAELGLTPGVVMQVVHKNGGPMLIAVRGARLALGRGVTDKILVEELDHTVSS